MGCANFVCQGEDFTLAVVADSFPEIPSPRYFSLPSEALSPRQGLASTQTLSLASCVGIPACCGWAWASIP